jgi:hypothetical protein
MREMVGNMVDDPICDVLAMGEINADERWHFLDEVHHPFVLHIVALEQIHLL